MRDEDFRTGINAAPERGAEQDVLASAVSAGRENHAEGYTK